MVLEILIFILLLLLTTSVYFNIKFGMIILRMQDEIEDCLDAFDEKYGIFAKILEKPIFFDSIEIRQVIQEIKSSQALLLRVANIIASPGGDKS